MIKNKNEGIHTIELYHSKRSYDKNQRIIEDLFELQRRSEGQRFIKEIRRDSEHINRVYHVNGGSIPDGIVMRIEQIRPVGGIRFKVNPDTLLHQEYDPLGLYRPKKGDRLIQDTFDEVAREFDASPLHRSWEYERDHVTLSRIDLTWDLYFDPSVDLTEVIRLFRHGDIGKYKKSTFGDKERDRHSFRIEKGPMVMTVYDKGFEMVHHKKVRTSGETCANVLRIEITLLREAFGRKLHLKKKVQHYQPDQLLYFAYSNGREILFSCLDDIFPTTGRHLAYQKAEKEIKQCAEPSLQEPMLFLLEKTSRCSSFSLAKKKTREKYSYGKTKFETLLKEFERIRVDPVTLKKDSRLAMVKNFRTMDL